VHDKGATTYRESGGVGVGIRVTKLDADADVLALALALPLVEVDRVYIHITASVLRGSECTQGQAKRSSIERERGGASTGG
jgi:hypothetical protein